MAIYNGTSTVVEFRADNFAGTDISNNPVFGCREIIGSFTCILTSSSQSFIDFLYEECDRYNEWAKEKAREIITNRRRINLYRKNNISCKVKNKSKVFIRECNFSNFRPVARDWRGKQVR